MGERLILTGKYIGLYSKRPPRFVKIRYLFFWKTRFIFLSWVRIRTGSFSSSSDAGSSPHRSGQRPGRVQRTPRTKRFDALTNGQVRKPNTSSQIQNI